MCFLIPILSDVIQGDIHRIMGSDTGYSYGCTALLLFPTKALAQDQLSKLSALLSLNPDAAKHCRPGIIDGDIPHDQRESIIRECNIILTNPDTLHANILPGWKKSYKEFLARVRYIAIDELHLYSGTFGSHVRMVLSRLIRICSFSHLNVGASKRGSDEIWTRPIFVGCSATVLYPEDHFRFVCPLTSDDSVSVLDSETDGSPCSKKYFFLWNPPIILQNDRSFRRHAADETAILLAELVRKKIRCIAFCATRLIAEWVYEKSCQFLTPSDAPFLEIYRGGYSSEVRRKIEQRLFHNDIIAVVATSALEVGVDIGVSSLILTFKGCHKER
jgi:DEAD/DEAH box helicase domain-containing protein